jgi:hypothetical protein
MPSVALREWQTTATAALNAIAAARARTADTGPERRHASRELNFAYVVLLTAHFQRFCRDLHTEAVDHIVGVVAPAAVQDVVLTQMLEGRQLGRRNPTPSTLTADFGRLGFDIWLDLRRSHALNDKRRATLTNLTTWRNAIAHGDVGEAMLVPRPPLHRRHVETWRATCRALAGQLDLVVGRRVASLVGRKPW